METFSLCCGLLLHVLPTRKQVTVTSVHLLQLS